MQLSLNRPLVALRAAIQFLQTTNHRFSIYSESVDIPAFFKYFWSFAAGHSIINCAELLQTAYNPTRDKLHRDTSKIYGLVGDLLYYIRSKVLFFFLLHFR